MDEFTVIGPLAYQGKRGCTSMICTRRFFRTDGTFGDCIGWHCSYCDEPCSSQGHRCDVGDTLLAESERLAGLGELDE